MTDDEIVQMAIDKAIAAGKANGFKEGDVVACRSDEYTYEFLRAEGDEAIVEIAPRLRSPGGPSAKKLPLAEIFDVDLLGRFSTEIKAQAIAEETLGKGATCTIVKLK